MFFTIKARDQQFKDATTQRILFSWALLGETAAATKKWLGKL